MNQTNCQAVSIISTTYFKLRSMNFRICSRAIISLLWYYFLCHNFPRISYNVINIIQLDANWKFKILNKQLATFALSHCTDGQKGHNDGLTKINTLHSLSFILTSKLAFKIWKCLWYDTVKLVHMDIQFLDAQYINEEDQR